MGFAVIIKFVETAKFDVGAIVFRELRLALFEAALPASSDSGIIDNSSSFLATQLASV